MQKNKNKSNRTPRSKKGFTIIETSLVTAFMALLMIAIATVTTSISALYRKGITLKAVSSVGRNLVTELTTTINSSPSIDSISLCNNLLPDINDEEARKACMTDKAYKYVFQSWDNKEYKEKPTDPPSTVQYGGVLCTGEYSYVWNTYYGLYSGHTFYVKFKYGNGAGEETILGGYGSAEIEDKIKMIRFKDSTYLACSANVNNRYNIDFADDGIIDITHFENNFPNIMAATDFQNNLLQPSDTSDSRDIALDLYELTIFPVSQDPVTLRSFFSGTFILATERGEVSIVRSGDYCNVNDYQGDTASNLMDLGSEFNYCGINKFNFAARTAGSGI